MIELSKVKQNETINMYNYIFLSNNYTPEYLLDFLDWMLPWVYQSGTWVWENYNLKKHTLMVLKQFERYFGNKDIWWYIDKNIFRLILWLHDIGKPLAISHWNKKLQHKYNPIMISKIFEYLQIDENHRKIAIVLSKNDTYGKYIKKQLSLEKAKLEFTNNINESWLNKKDYFSIQLIYYMVDAWSYTLDAWGKYSLDRLFVFNHKDNTLKLKSHIFFKLKKLLN